MAAPNPRPRSTSNVVQFFHFLGYIFPYLLLIGGYMVSALQYRVTDTIPPDEKEWFYIAILVEIGLAVLWVIMDFIVISSEKTTGDMIKWNAAISSTTNNILLAIFFTMAAIGELGWWLVVPTFFQVIDDYIVTNRGIVNALQKPFGLPGSAGH
jgi:hypothetical protein